MQAIRRWRGWQTPAVQALLVQLAALLPTGLVFLLWPGFTTLPFSIGHAALVQGIGAALLTRWRHLAAWWIVIELLFPVAALTTAAVHLPPLLFLLGFLFLLLLYWSTFRTQVPFYPSGPRVWRAVLALLPATPGVRVIDIGSGLGGLAMNLAVQRPDASITGIELAPLPWLISQARARLMRNPARFVRGDYEKLDFAQFDVVFAYLSPAAMPALWQKAQREMRPGALLLSYEFFIAGTVPEITVLPHPQGPVLYGWRR